MSDTNFILLSKNIPDLAYKCKTPGGAGNQSEKTLFYLTSQLMRDPEELHAASLNRSMAINSSLSQEILVTLSINALYFYIDGFCI